MKVVAFNSSPRGDETSKTKMLLDALVAGMRDAGADVETINLRQKKIRNCLGCYVCWTKTPGVCVQKDDMTNELFPELLASDIAIYATPLYHWTVNATLKTFIERRLPIMEPWHYRRDGKTYHPMRQQPPKAVVLSVSGFPEAFVFNQLSSYVNFLFGEGLIAEIYRPAAELMALPEMAEARTDILDALTQAGSELVQSQRISPVIKERITRPIGGDFDAIAKMANVFWKTCIREGLTPAEFQQRRLVPRPDSVEDFLVLMASGFNPAGAAGTSAVLQFNFSGEVEEICHFRIENGRIEPTEGAAEKADLIVESPFDLWMDIVTGKADGQQMLMQQRYKTSGDLSLLLRMKDMFGRRDS
jgi:multimeric flavodoxin WrbA/putative sterol carrier protein